MTQPTRLRLAYHRIQTWFLERRLLRATRYVADLESPYTLAAYIELAISSLDLAMRNTRVPGPAFRRLAYAQNYLEELLRQVRSGALQELEQKSSQA